MAKLKLFSMDGKNLGEASASDKVFAIAPKQHVINSALIWYLAKTHQGTASAKNRGEVSGGGRKPWKQKGTGRARAGDNRSPIWRKGGVVFPPKPRDYSFALPKKIRNLSLKMVLSDKLKEDKLSVVDSFELVGPKTKEFVGVCKKLKIKDSALFVDDKPNSNLVRASRNIPKIKVLHMNYLNVHDLLKYDEIILTKAALTGLEAMLK